MASAFKAGDRIGKYRIVELIGHGGMASVYLGRDPDLERNVAVKILHPHLESREEAKERFRREAKAIAKVSHPNIVEIYDYSGEDAAQSYIVTQLVAGGNLKDVKDRWGECPPEAVASIALQVAEGLFLAHSCGVIHRDIKPENLLLDRDGTVKIADFGIAHLADSRDMTVTGQILGSPYYMSPEQVTGGRMDERSDIFSFGSFLFWLATGRQAFEGPNPHAVLRSIVEKEVAEAERLAPSMGRRLGALIARCLSKSPDARYPSLREIIAELKAYLELSGVTDAAGEVRALLESPDAYRAARRERSIPIWADKAQELEGRGDVTGGMDLYNRILALDPENKLVLDRIRRVRSARTQRRAVKWAAGVVMLVSLLAGGFLLGKTLFPRKPAGSAPAAGAKGAGELAPLWKIGQEEAGKPAAAGTETGAAAAAAAGAEGAEGTAIKKVKERHAVPGEIVKKVSALGPGGALRRVRFVPFPKTITIVIDGKKVGAYFSHQEMDLAVGEHTIRFEPIDVECCEPAEWSVNVLPGKPGEKPQTIGKRLVIRPALLVVTASRAGEVLVGGKKAGKTGELIEVHTGDSPLKVTDVAVSAAGCDPWSSREKLKAGRKLELKAALACH